MEKTISFTDTGIGMTEEELKGAPEGTKTIDMTGMPGKKFAITVSCMDCTGCGII